MTHISRGSSVPAAPVPCSSELALKYLLHVYFSYISQGMKCVKYLGISVKNLFMYERSVPCAFLSLENCSLIPETIACYNWPSPC